MGGLGGAGGAAAGAGGANGGRGGSSGSGGGSAAGGTGGGGAFVLTSSKIATDMEMPADFTCAATGTPHLSATRVERCARGNHELRDGVRRHDDHQPRT